MLRKLNDYNLLKFERGIFEPMDRPEEIADYHFSPEEQMRINHNKGRIISGTPESVKSQLLQLADEFDVDEIMITTMTYSRQDRVQSFQLLAKAFDLEYVPV